MLESNRVASGSYNVTPPGMGINFGSPIRWFISSVRWLDLRFVDSFSQFIRLARWFVCSIRLFIGSLLQFVCWISVLLIRLLNLFGSFVDSFTQFVRLVLLFV